jgi:hypothetical protein
MVWQGYKNLRKFVSWADDRASLRAAIRDDLGVDVTAAGPAGTAARVSAAAVICAWEYAKDSVEKENALRAESKVLQQHRPASTQERLAMRRAYEDEHGKLPSNEVPSSDYLASKMEECETEEPSASPLDEVSSIEESETQNLQASLDVTGRVRISKQKTKGKMPATSEELRLKLKLEANTWVFLSKKFTSKQWLQKVNPATWSRYADYLLGEKVANLKIPVEGGSSSDLSSVRVPWAVVLHYEYEIRKAALRDCRENGTQLDEALKASMKDAELKEVHFTSPLALMPKGKRSWDDRGKKDDGNGKWTRVSAKGKGKGKKGSGKGKGKSKGKMLSSTPDGRQICFNFNNNTGCNNGACTRVHMCRVPGCSATDHGMSGHPWNTGEE